MNAIETVRKLQQEEIENGFKNGELYNELEDLIYSLNNPQSKLESIHGDMYGVRSIK